MCGISGLFGSGWKREQLEAMVKVQHHRGPDAQGIYISPDGLIGFGHNRLSLLDLSPAGNQPFENGKHVLSYNGEIYNYEDLRNKLANRGVSFHSTSDTAVLFESLIHFGVEETLKSIQGMFSFSYYNVEQKTLFLCRDRFGIKPLHWKFENNKMIWASEVKAIAMATRLKLEPVKTLFSMASLGDKFYDATVFEDVSQVPAGAYLVLRHGQKPEIHKYYDLVEQVDPGYYQELNRMSATQIENLFFNLLETSVKKMLMGDAPVGAFVSGGIDSGIIAAIAAKYQPDFQLFTADVVGKHSEYEDAQRLSKVIERPLKAVHFLPEMFIPQLAKATYHYECPIITHANSIPFACVAGIARENSVKAVLTGEGSDELFMGYSSLYLPRLKQAALMPIRLLQGLYGISPRIKRYLFPEAEVSVAGFIRHLSNGFEEKIVVAGGTGPYSFLPPGLAQEQYQTIRMFKGHLFSLLHRNDRMGMISSIESRFPFLDEALVHFAINLPVKWKRKYTFDFMTNKVPFIRDKWIVRQGVNRHLPVTLTNKKKSGFPMYGYKLMSIREGYFQEGYVASLLNLSKQAQDFMQKTQPPYLIAKLAAVDIFGRLFEFGQTTDEVTERLLKYMTIRTE